MLAVNSGSSSLKIGLYENNDGHLSKLVSGSVSGVGRVDGSLKLNSASGEVLLDRSYTLSTQQQALGEIMRALSIVSPGELSAIGHRVVHGGPNLHSHQMITPEVLETLKASVHFAPLHIPPSVVLIEEMSRLLPDVPQFACFDTAFHSTLPPVAQHYAVPERFYEQGLRRYGFHGLSYESIVARLKEDGELPRRLICAHLGSGASLAAVLDGKSVDTSMGLTPLAGIPMSSRPGDLDPGVLIYILREERFTVDALEQMLNYQSGLYSLSGGETDMQSLVASRNKGGPRATLAVEAFAMGVRKFIGAYAAVLGGVDMLVFSGGIGEHSEEVRALCCQGLEPLGITTEEARNPRPGGKVRVMQADEEKQIAGHCFRLLRETRPVSA
ncbi:MAG: acetate/propionate family kinase [Acidobacteriaceae bacterium]